MNTKKIFIFPSCTTKLFSTNKNSLTSKLLSILRKLNYEVIILKLNNECCGLMYDSMGFPGIGKRKLNKLLTKIKKITIGESYPVLIENSSCLLEIISYSQDYESNLIIQNPITFIYNELMSYPLKKQNKTIMLHINCSITKLKKDEEVISLAKRCAEKVIIPNDILCCGFAGNKGFTTPELNKNALKTLKEFIPKDCKEGYTCLETCALGFSKYSGIPYSSIFHLIDDCMS